MAQEHTITGKFVHVVATVNLQERSGEILYVNPSTVGVSSSGTGENVNLVLRNGAGEEIHKVQPAIRRPTCETSANRTALIQEDIPYLDNMASVSLEVDGREVARFDAGQAATGAVPAATISAGAAPGDQHVRVGMPVPTAPTPGYSYTVQVRPSTSQEWNTLAVGRATPEIDINATQFPGAVSAEVRVLRTNGFTESLVNEAEVRFDTP